MRYSEDRFHLGVEIDVKGCEIPADERARMQTSLAPLGEAVSDFPASHLRITAVFHPRSQAYHVEMKLKLPGQTLFAGEEDAYLDAAFQRALQNLVREAQKYTPVPGRNARATAERRTALARAMVAPEDAGDGDLARAALDGDYRTFRTALAGYEEWLRKRVGRWVQRYPEAEARVGSGLAIGDLVEAVYLNAFEQFTRRPTGLRLSDWLESLMDPSLKALLRYPDRERENASLARTVREMSP
jgi:ribosome-associated translation inhibitor RaiA